MNILFADLTKKKDTILIRSHWMAILVLAVVIFLRDNLKEKRSVPLTSQALRILKTLRTPVENHCLTQQKVLQARL